MMSSGHLIKEQNALKRQSNKVRTREFSRRKSEQINSVTKVSTESAKDETVISQGKEQKNDKGGGNGEIDVRGKKAAKVESKRRGRKLKKKNKDLNDPMKILERVLDTSDFKVANLSMIVQEKFYKSQEYRDELHELLKDVVYKSTVDAVRDGSSDIRQSVLPRNFDGQINVPLHSIPCLPCIHEETKHRFQKPKKSRNKPKNKN